MAEKTVKGLLIAAGAAVFAFGQYFIIEQSSYGAGGIFSLLGVVVFSLAFIGPLVSFIAFRVIRLKEWLKELERREKEKKATEEKLKLLPPEKQVEIQEKINKEKENEREEKKKSEFPAKVKDFLKEREDPEKKLYTFSFNVPKWTLLAACVLLLILIQVFIFAAQKVVPAFLSLAAGVALLVRYLTLKQDSFRVSFSMAAGLRFTAIIAGLASIIAGWILLINAKQQVQNIGVIFTTIGIFMCFFALPENKGRHDVHEDREEILFTENKLVNNPLVKLLMLGLVFLFVFLGNKIITSPDYNMFSMVFYALAISVLFFCLPLINFREKYSESRIFSVVKLVFILAALFIAYKAQAHFQANRVGEALKLYFIAAAIFIVAFPVYKHKDEENKIPLWVEVVFLAGITTVGIWLRLYEIDVRPFGLENDEAGGMVSVVKNFHIGQHPLYFYISELWYKVFGYNRIGMRALGVSVSIISIPVMYFAIRAAFNVRVAFFVTTVFAFLRWNLHYGRSGHGTVFAIIAITATLYFIVKMIKNRDKLSYFMAGLTSGMCWYGILTGWFVFLAPLGYFIMKSLSTKKYFIRNTIGLIVFLLGFWIFASQHVHNFFISKKTYFSRISEVSVFSQDPNAPRANPAKGIIDNTKRVLLMFNHHGDSRQRNSGGQPYEPTVDFVTAMFFFLGFLYAMYYTRYYLFFVLIMLFYSQAAGSIFSIEAPSAMRAVGTMIPMIVMAGITFDRVWLAFRRVFGRRLELVYLPLLLVIPLFFIPFKENNKIKWKGIITENYNQYFNRWVGGFDELATAAGMYAEEIGKSYRIYMHTSLFYPGHPPFRVYRWDHEVNSSNNFVDGIKNLLLIDDENYAVFFPHDTWEVTEFWIKNFDGKHEVIKHSRFNEKLNNDEGFGKFFEAVLISNESIKKKRGLRGSYNFSSTGTAVNVKNDAPVFTSEMADKVPYTAVWQGVFIMPEYGTVRFLNNGNVKAEMWVDGHKINFGSDMYLADGMHKVKIRAARNKASDTLMINGIYKRYRGSRAIGSGTFSLGDMKYIYSIPLQGFHAYYYNGGSSGEISGLVYEQITPTSWFQGRAVQDGYTISYRGTIDIPESGTYRFSVRRSGLVRILIDSKNYYQTGSAGDNPLSYENLKPVSEFNLSKGPHRIQIDAVGSGHLNVMWSDDKNRNWRPISPEFLKPDMEITKKIK